MKPYDFHLHIENAKNWESKTGRVLGKLSDWNCGRFDPETPVSLLEEAFTYAVETFTTYTETSITLQLGDAILADLHSNPESCFNANSALHLYGNATQALFASIYAIRESVQNLKFLVVHPSYYANHDSLKALQVPYHEYWRTLSVNGHVDLNNLRLFKEKNEFNAILITDPMYSTGIELTDENLKEILDFAETHDIWIIIDSSFSGLSWENPKKRWLDFIKIGRNGYKKCLVVDSPSKRLFTNNLKIGMVHCDKSVSHHLEKFSDSFVGNITGIQHNFFKRVFIQANKEKIEAICTNNTRKIIDNYEYLLSIAHGSSHIYFIRPDAGFHTMIFFKGLQTGTFNSMSFCEGLVNQGVFALPTNDYYYASSDPFGVRINLINSPRKWERLIRQFAEKGI